MRTGGFHEYPRDIRKLKATVISRYETKVTEPKVIRTPYVALDTVQLLFETSSHTTDD